MSEFRPKMQPLPAHAHFFTSLKQVEKRLKLETPSPPKVLSPLPPPPTAPPEVCIGTQTDSLSCPIYLHQEQKTATAAATVGSIPQESDAPQEFLTSSPDFPPTQKNPVRGVDESSGEAYKGVERSHLDDIELLMKLLGLSETRGGKGLERVGFGSGCDDQFYGEIVGVKGPKSFKELRRLEGWIVHFMKSENGGKKEPLRLAHLLLAKAAFIGSLEDSDGVEDFAFPSTIDDFLHNDPPED